MDFSVFYMDKTAVLWYNNHTKTRRTDMRIYYGDINDTKNLESTSFLQLNSCGNSVKKQRLGAAFQLLMPGMPMIYYGDEFAMKGGPDPDCRRGMVWKEDHQNSKMFAWYQNLIRLRKEYPCITEGETTFCETQDETGLIIIGKKLAEEELTLIFHGKKEPLELTQFKGQHNLITQKPFSGKIAGYDVAVLR